MSKPKLGPLWGLAKVKYNTNVDVSNIVATESGQLQHTIVTYN